MNDSKDQIIFRNIELFSLFFINKYFFK